MGTIRRLGRLAFILVAATAACSKADDRRVGNTASGHTIDTTGVVSRTDPNNSTPTAAPGAGDSVQALDVIERYYRLLDTKNFRGAYDLLDETPDRPAYEQFVEQQEEVSQLIMMPGSPGRIEGAAGSRYIEIPVMVAVTRADGTRQKLEGSHTLRKSIVDGASAAQRDWRIFSSRVSPAR